jgi:hypothetical protein
LKIVVILLNADISTGLYVAPFIGQYDIQSMVSIMEIAKNILDDEGQMTVVIGTLMGN